MCARMAERKQRACRNHDIITKESREHIHIHHDNIALSVLVVAICCPFLPHRIEIFCSVSAFGLLKQTQRYRNKHAQNLQELKLARTETCKN